MKILVISQSYWPEQSGYLYGEIVERFISDGNDVDVITYNIPSDKKTDLDVNKKNPYIIRIKTINKFQYSRFGKFINTIIFGLGIIFICLKKKRYDKIVCACSHLLFIGLITSIISKIYNTKFIYSIGDLHPESGLASGDFKNKSLVKILKYLDTYACKVSQYIVVLSDDMVNSLRNRGILESNKIIKIPNVPHNYLKQLENSENYKILKKNQKKFRIVFTGNIGRFQGLETVIEAMKLIKDNKRIEIIFLGSGVSEKNLKRNCKELLNKSIFFIKPQEIKFVNSLISSADIGLVSLLDGVEKCAFPSKMSGYLSMHCPLLVVANEKSELYRMTLDLKIGVSVPQNKPEELSKLLLKISNLKNFKDQYKKNIINVTNGFYSRNKILDQWSEIIKEH